MNYFRLARWAAITRSSSAATGSDNYSFGQSRVGGDATARFPTAAELASATDCSTIAAGCQVDTRRWSQAIYDLKNILRRTCRTRSRTTA